MTDKKENLIPWIEKYRPRFLKQATYDKNLEDLFQNSVKASNMPHFLFYGPPGTGKTSAILAMGREIFKEHFPSRVKEFNASDDRGIGAVRDKITSEAKKFVSTTVSVSDNSIIPAFKIIILDESDLMTEEAQDALRVIIEQYSTVTRFCFICNRVNKITDAIKSRCTAVYFKKLSIECLTLKLKEIAQTEQMILSPNIFNKIIDLSDGDMRRAIMLLQNVKYLYNFKQLIFTPIQDIDISKLKLIQNISLSEPIKKEITESEICKMAAIITMEEAMDIINRSLRCEKIIEIMALCKNIISNGYPTDSILSQLNKAILETNDLTTEQKAIIIKYSGRIFFKMKECANEYIQLLDYLSCVNGVKKGNSAYLL